MMTVKDQKEESTVSNSYVGTQRRHQRQLRIVRRYIANVTVGILSVMTACKTKIHGFVVNTTLNMKVRNTTVLRHHHRRRCRRFNTTWTKTKKDGHAKDTKSVKTIHEQTKSNDDDDDDDDNVMDNRRSVRSPEDLMLSTRQQDITDMLKRGFMTTSRLRLLLLPFQFMGEKEYFFSNSIRWVLRDEIKFLLRSKFHPVVKEWKTLERTVGYFFSKNDDEVRNPKLRLEYDFEIKRKLLQLNLAWKSATILESKRRNMHVYYGIVDRAFNGGRGYKRWCKCLNIYKFEKYESND